MANDATINEINEKSGSTTHLKDVFDQSLAVLCEGASSGRVRRSCLPLHIDAANLQKRALSDAADALAALWKISKPKSPNLCLLRLRPVGRRP
jgi:hypothetical protein